MPCKLVSLSYFDDCCAVVEIEIEAVVNSLSAVIREEEMFIVKIQFPVASVCFCNIVILSLYTVVSTQTTLRYISVYDINNQQGKSLLTVHGSTNNIIISWFAYQCAWLIEGCYAASWRDGQGQCTQCHTLILYGTISHGTNILQQISIGKFKDKIICSNITNLDNIFETCKSPSQTLGHTEWAVCLVIAYIVTLIFLRGLCGYVWVTYSLYHPQGDFISGI